MGIYLFRKEILTELLDNDLGDFGHHVIPRAVPHMRVKAHLFNGYWRDIGTIRSYYDAHMDLVLPQAPFDFYNPRWPFFTHPRYLPGSRITNTSIYRTVLAGGHVLSDVSLSEAVLGVRTVLREATVKRSLIMGADPHHVPDGEDGPPVGIGKGAVIENAIIDKNARIGRNVRIVNEQGLQEGEGPWWVIRDGIVVVPHNAVVPDGSVI
jgi:glucose-1-phosphate adenylyltransferase